MNKKILVLDIETGGLDHENDALLTVTMKFLNEHNILDLKVKPFEDSKIHEQALKVNKIDVEQHLKDCYEEIDVCHMISGFIKNNKPIICGKNVDFDIRFLRQLFKRNDLDFDELVHWHTLDLTSVTYFLELSGFSMPESKSLSSVCEYFLINQDWHTSKGDVLATEELLNTFVKLIE